MNRLLYIRIEERDNMGNVTRKIERIGPLDNKKSNVGQVRNLSIEAGTVFGLILDRKPIVEKPTKKKTH